MHIGNPFVHSISRSQKNLLLIVGVGVFVMFFLIADRKIGVPSLQAQSDARQSESTPALKEQESPENTEETTEPTDASQAISSPTAETRTLTLAHLYQVLLIGIVILWGYSLVMSGKHGLGWSVLLAIGGVFVYLIRAIRSIFQEVTSKNEVGDWDDE
jgi:hypothetical protein